MMDQLQQHHERELQRLQQEKEWLLAEETAATASGEDQGCAMGRAWGCHIELGSPLSRELGEAVSRGWKRQKFPVVQIEKEEVRQ